MCQAALWLELVLCFQEEERPVLQRWMSVSLFFSFSFSIKKKEKQIPQCLFIHCQRETL